MVPPPPVPSDEPDEHEAVAQALSTEIRLESGTLGVLIVEPDPDLQSKLASMLRERGHCVVGTSSGDGALALVEQWPVEMVFVEHDLPRLDPFDVIRRLNAACDSVGIVLMSEKTSPEFRAAAIRAGATTTLQKPFDVNALGDALDAAEF